MISPRPPAPSLLRAPGRWTPTLLDHEPPRLTRRRQSPSQQSSVHSHRFPTMSDRPAAFEPKGADRARSQIPRPLLVASPLGPRGRPLPFRLGRQPIRHARRPAQPRHRRLCVVPTHAPHRMTIRLPRKEVTPGITEAITCTGPRRPTRTPDTRPPSPRSDPEPDRRPAAPPSQDTRRSPGNTSPGRRRHITADCCPKHRRRRAGDPRAGGSRQPRPAHAHPGCRRRSTRRRAQCRQPGLRQLAEHPVRGN